MSHIKVKLIVSTLRINKNEVYFCPYKSPRGQKPKWPPPQGGQIHFFIRYIETYCVIHQIKAYCVHIENIPKLIFFDPNTGP